MRGAVGSLRVERPRTLREALKWMTREPLVPLAGGTDLFVLLNAGTLRPATYPPAFIDLWGLDELRGIRAVRRAGRNVLTFGALTTFSDCIRSTTVQKHLPILARAASEVGGLQIQNRGTLAGNIGNGSPAADGVPVLAAAHTTVILRSASSTREVALTNYFTGYRQSVRRPDELIVALHVEVPPGPQYFRKVGTRAAQAISKVVAAAIGPRVAFGSLGPTVILPRATIAYLEAGGRDASEAQRLLAEEIAPIDDIRSTATYRKRVAQNLLGEVVAGLNAANLNPTKRRARRRSR